MVWHQDRTVKTRAKIYANIPNFLLVASTDFDPNTDALENVVLECLGLHCTTARENWCFQQLHKSSLGHATAGGTAAGKQLVFVYGQDGENSSFLVPPHVVGCEIWALQILCVRIFCRRRRRCRRLLSSH